MQKKLTKKAGFMRPATYFSIIELSNSRAKSRIQKPLDSPTQKSYNKIQENDCKVQLARL